ncbi:MAG: phage portal protein [Clostridia bacterium]|nr:phage portal protein [Clostridia bacterium]
MAKAISAFLSPHQAWKALLDYREKYYRQYAALYSGDFFSLVNTASTGSFWNRNGKCRIHVPIAADIAATSADLLFSEAPRLTCYDEKTESDCDKHQQRLEKLITENNVHSLLNEAAESCAVLGDVYLKLNWRRDLDHPILTITQGDAAWPEYRLGQLMCIHFFSVLRDDTVTGGSAVIRIYERYERGKIQMAVFTGNGDSLGNLAPASALKGLGFSPEIKAPVQDMLSVHIPNIRPNRLDRSSQHGRSDFDGLRGMMDSLDETYSSWMRDIRLAKARLIVPGEYLRRKNKDMFDGNSYTYEFDEDVETLVALDIDPQHDNGNPITPSQFEIRSAEHAATAADLIRNIVSEAGYAPQTFGLNIEGLAQSGTALRIREKKSYNTRGKKIAYWRAGLEKIMTSMIHLDAALYPRAGSDAKHDVKVHFADNMANDLSTTSSAVNLLHSAVAASTEVKVAMLHPDWSKKQVAEEVAKIMRENGISTGAANTLDGDYHDDGNPPNKGKDQKEIE